MSGGSTEQWQCFPIFLKAAHPHAWAAPLQAVQNRLPPAGINEEGANLMPPVVHQRPMQTSSREAGAFSTRRLLQSDIKDQPADDQVPVQEENTRATALCDSTFYKWVVHQREAVCKPVQPAALAACALSGSRPSL